MGRQGFLFCFDTLLILWRSYFALTDERTTSEVYDLPSLLNEVHAKLQRETDVLQPRSLVVGSAADVQQDTFQVSRGRRHLRDLDPGTRMRLRPQDLLNFQEQQRLDTYVSLWQDSVRQGKDSCDWQDLVCHLGDSPGTGWCTWSNCSGRVPTLRRSSGIMWSASAGRQLLMKELYTAMGFAALPECAAVAGVAPYNVWGYRSSYNHVRAALGNSQHVANIGIFSLCAMACTACKGA